MLVDDDTLMTFGGLTTRYVNTAVTSVYEYKISTKRWTAKAAMTANHYAGACGPAGAGKVVVAGGRSQPSTSEVYDIATNKWTTGESTRQDKFCCWNKGKGHIVDLGRRQQQLAQST